VIQLNLIGVLLRSILAENIQLTGIGGQFRKVAENGFDEFGTHNQIDSA
jgi:hypothetical protein